jgi:phenylacetate-coenzyme A ligase PaaK-like adenylate-forming protein
MPLIRLNLGDLAVAGQACCSCGLPFSTMSQLQGRIIDYIPLPDGRRLHPFEILNSLVLAAGSWLAEYQIVQLQMDQIRILAVPCRPATNDEMARLLAVLQEVVGGTVQVQIEQVPRLPRDAAGKLHLCRSLLS